MDSPFLGIHQPPIAPHLEVEVGELLPYQCWNCELLVPGHLML